MRIAFTKFSLPTEGAVIVTVTDKLKLGSLASKLNKELGNALTKAIKQQGFLGKRGEILTLLAPANSEYEVVILAGLGAKEDLKGTVLRSLGGKLLVNLNANKIKKATIIPEYLENNSELIAELADGFGLRAYQFIHYKTKEKEKLKFQLEEVIISCEEPKQVEKLYTQRQNIQKGVFFARNLVTEPANILYPESYAERITKELQPLGVEVSILDTKRMKKEGMGALLGVAQGSVRDGRLVVMEWKGDKKTKKTSAGPLGFVGKGVTFDTGGISIKPAGNMWDMKYDMGGSAAVVGLMNALARNKVQIHAVGVVALVENMPDGNAQRPGDVVTSMSGQTIEVLNTDAEGRLVLADALTYIQRYYKPQSIIDLATLTGAIVVALGSEYAGLFSNHDGLSTDLLNAAAQTDEKLWRLPLGDSFDKLIDSTIADMQNISLDKGAGSITAAQFLKRFIEDDTAWAHLDIAGMAWADKEKDICGKGATGFGVRLLYQFVQDHIGK